MSVLSKALLGAALIPVCLYWMRHLQAKVY